MSPADYDLAMEKINLADKLTQISEHWRPKVVGELNGQEVKLVTPRSRRQTACGFSD